MQLRVQGRVRAEVPVRPWVPELAQVRLAWLRELVRARLAWRLVRARLAWRLVRLPWLRVLRLWTLVRSPQPA